MIIKNPHRTRGTSEESSCIHDWPNARASSLTLRLTSWGGAACRSWTDASLPRVTGQKPHVACRTRWMAYWIPQRWSACCCSGSSLQSRVGRQVREDTTKCLPCYGMKVKHVNWTDWDVWRTWSLKMSESLRNLRDWDASGFETQFQNL